MDNFQTWFDRYGWSIELAGFLALILITTRALKYLFAKFKEHHHLKEADWRSHIEYAIIGPSSALLWVFFAAFVLDLFVRYFTLQDKCFNITPLRNAGIVLCIAWFFFRWKSILLQAAASGRAAKKLALKPGSIEIIGKICTLAILFFALLLILQSFGLNVVPLIAFGSIGAAALGFASKDIIANFYGGLTLYTTRPFTVNEFVELPQKNILGTVEEIGWYLTTVRNLQKKPIYIPNAFFSTECLINWSRMTHRRIEETINIRFEDAPKIPNIIDQIRMFLEKNPNIDCDLPIDVFVETFNSFSISIEIKAYTFATQYASFMEAKQEVLLKVQALLTEARIDMPCPTTEIIHRNRPV